MAYYFISEVPEILAQFQKLHKILNTAPVIKDLKNLKSIIPSLDDGDFVFVYYGPDQTKHDEMVLLLRNSSPAIKIIYVTNGLSQDIISAHRASPLGGDAYVDIGANPDDFKNLMKKFRTVDLDSPENRLEGVSSGIVNISSNDNLTALAEHPKSKEITKIFSSSIQVKPKSPNWQSAESLKSAHISQSDKSGVLMSDKDQELSLENLDEIELAPEEQLDHTVIEDAGLDLALPEGDELALGEESIDLPVIDDGMDFNLDDDLSLDGEELQDSLRDESSAVNASNVDNEVIDDLGAGDFADLGSLEDPSSGNLDDLDNLESIASLDDDGLSFNDTDLGANDQTVVANKDSISGQADEDLSLEFGESVGVSGDLSSDAKEKLKEIDAIMHRDATMGSFTGLDLSQFKNQEDEDSNLDEPLVSDDLNLDSLSFGDDQPLEEKAKKRKVETKKNEIEEPTTKLLKNPKNSPAPQVSSASPSAKTPNKQLGEDLREISGAYSEELGRTQATISNLRSDREELLERVQKLEEERMLQSRQNLTLRAELDEKKIELSIIRKKLNEEISELKDKMRYHDEKRLILEEKNKVLTAELDKSAQRNKIDIKKVQMRERELEQKLELLKSDAEGQIKNRDLKILELKRKIDSMEFDMESITTQEKRSVESRFELEDKLGKAIKTLRTAISVLEDESEKSVVLEALKKNIDM